MENENGPKWHLAVMVAVGRRRRAEAVGRRRLGFTQWAMQQHGLGFLVLKGVDTVVIGAPGTYMRTNCLNVNTGN